MERPKHVSDEELWTEILTAENLEAIAEHINKPADELRQVLAQANELDRKVYVKMESTRQYFLRTMGLS